MSRSRTRTFGCLAVSLALGLGACGDLDNETTVKDLRVLAVRSEPAGFLVPLDNPGSLVDTKATLTALVVDPQGQGATLSVSGEACPDYIDTITAASGMTTKICPTADAIGKLPEPLRPLLATTTLTPGTDMPIPGSSIQYEPKVTYGITPEQLAVFFNDPTTMPTGVEVIDRSTQYNRDFSFDAIVNLNFTLGDETASVIKRVVYWPLLPDRLLPEDPGPCGGPQVANRNPVITSVDLFAHRVEGDPVDRYADEIPTISRSAGDQLYVQPTYDPASIENYLLRVQKTETGQVQTECRHELLTFQFYATAGTFSPNDRQSELLPLFTSGDGKVHLDSQWELPKPENAPPAGIVTIWVIVRDERAGSSWASRTIRLTL